jgi:glucose/mannose-6-phosphate isomerase
MIEYLQSLDRQISDAVRIGSDFRFSLKRRRISKIVFCGMGGSAIGGDILRRLAFRQDKIPFAVNRSSAMPKWVDRQTLVIASSYSGNTREVLASLRDAFQAKALVLIVTSGGKLEDLARKQKTACLKIPAGIPPRCAIGYLTFALLPVLNRIHILSVSEKDIRETIHIVRNIPRARAKRIATLFENRFVRFYGASGLMEPVLVRWKSQLAENAKTSASVQVLPEMFHNEIEGWKAPKAFVQKSLAVFFCDSGDPAWIRKKEAAALRIIRGSGGKAEQIFSQGKSQLARIFSLIVLGDWVSYELAVRYGVDPIAIPNIDILKKIG